MTPDELAAMIRKALGRLRAERRARSPIAVTWDVVAAEEAVDGLVACCTQLREALVEIAEAPGRSVLSLIACEALGVKYGAAVGVSADPPPPGGATT